MMVNEQVSRCIYCKEEKTYSPRDGKLSHFSREHVVHFALVPGFANNLTLLKQVCADCNLFFGNTIDQQFTRGGIDGLLRYQQGMKSLSKLTEYDGRKVDLRAVSDRNLSSPNVVPTRQGETLGFAVKPHIRFEQKDGKWIIVMEEQISELDVLVDFSMLTGIIRFRAEAKEDEARLQRLLNEKLVTLNRTPIEITGTYIPEDEGVYAEVTAGQEEFRSIAKIGFNYMSFVTKGISEHLPFFHWFDMTREFIRFAKSPEYAVVQLIGSFGLSDYLENGSLKGGHNIALGVLPWCGDYKRLVCLISLFDRVLWVVNLSWTYKGPERDLVSVHHWNLGDKSIKKMKLFDSAEFVELLTPRLNQ